MTQSVSECLCVIQVYPACKQKWLLSLSPFPTAFPAPGVAFSVVPEPRRLQTELCFCFFFFLVFLDFHSLKLIILVRRQPPPVSASGMTDFFLTAMVHFCCNAILKGFHQSYSPAGPPPPRPLAAGTVPSCLQYICFSMQKLERTSGKHTAGAEEENKISGMIAFHSL